MGLRRSLVVAQMALAAHFACAWTVDVPILNNDLVRYGGWEAVRAELTRAEADWVELGMGPYELDPVRRQAKFATLRENCRRLQTAGIVPCARTWAFWFEGKSHFTTIRAADGFDAKTFACPLDPDFRRMEAEYVADMARSGARIVILDDDYCYGNRHAKALTCTCPLHLRRIGELLDEPVTAADLQKRVLSGGPNRVRDAWLKVNGESLKAFACEMRKAVDAVDPTIRLGLCGQATTWDVDGVDSATLARLLAGRTRPLLRLISGPYWAARNIRGFRMQDVFEYNRLQLSWCGDDIDVFGEGDPYPRPRYACPAAYLELFDLMLRANGGFAGDFKYMIDFFSPVDYERGYVDRHVRNRPLRTAIDRLFGGKAAVGVRVRERMRKFAGMTAPEGRSDTPWHLATLVPAAGAFLADCGVPTAYEDGDGVTIAFGDNVRDLAPEAMRRGVILDVPAAQILADSGVDVGLRKVGARFKAADEWFDAEKAFVHASPSFEGFRISIDEKAVVDSSFVLGGLGFTIGAERTPAVYFYANADGGRFMVYAFDGYFSGPGKNRGMARARQVSRGVKWLSGKPLPAFTSGNPDVYLLAKKSADAMAVGVWNLFADEMLDPVVELDAAYDSVTGVGCDVTLVGNRVKIDHVPAFSFAAFEVRKALVR